MYQPQARNFLSPLKRSYKLHDSQIFRKYLTMPRAYMKGMFQLYPDNLQQVNVQELVQLCDEHYWGRIKMEQTKEEMHFNVQCNIARVPPMYITRNEFPATTGANLKVYASILEDVTGFTSLGKVLYLYSDFEDNALLAASNIVKAGIRSKLMCRMLTLNKFMDEVKTFENSHILENMEGADIACLSMIGTVYKAQSGFTESTFAAFVDQRRLAGKTTLLSSHLTPDEFYTRYGFSLDKFGAICMKFEDTKMVATVAELAKELAALKKGG